jgi:general secretion pathway protein G
MPCNKGRSRVRRKPHRGFTLVELMVVIVLIGLLSGAVTLSVRGYLVSGKQDVARMEISKISQALETMYSAQGRFPTNDEGLEVLAEPSEKFPEGILSKVPSDPWGRSYQYNTPGRGRAYEIVCLGADGREGGDGADKDITSYDAAADSKS